MKKFLQVFFLICLSFSAKAQILSDETILHLEHEKEIPATPQQATKTNKNTTEEDAQKMLKDIEETYANTIYFENLKSDIQKKYEKDLEQNIRQTSPEERQAIYRTQEAVKKRFLNQDSHEMIDFKNDEAYINYFKNSFQLKP